MLKLSVLSLILLQNVYGIRQNVQTELSTKSIKAKVITDLIWVGTSPYCNGQCADCKLLGYNHCCGEFSSQYSDPYYKTNAKKVCESLFDVEIVRIPDYGVNCLTDFSPAYDYCQFCSFAKALCYNEPNEKPPICAKENEFCRGDADHITDTDSDCCDGLACYKRKCVLPGHVELKWVGVAHPGTFHGECTDGKCTDCIGSSYNCVGEFRSISESQKLDVELSIKEKEGISVKVPDFGNSCRFGTKALCLVRPFAVEGSWAGDIYHSGELGGACYSGACNNCAEKGLNCLGEYKRFSSQDHDAAMQKALNEFGVVINIPDFGKSCTTGTKALCFKSK